MSIYDAMKHNNSMNIELLDKNDNRRLTVSYPELIKEWDFDKNILDINKMYVSSNKKVWWKCSKCGHSWEAYIGNRTLKNSGCPKCNSGNQGSFMEFMLYTIIKEYFKDAEYQFKVNNMSFDIGIPNPATVIEYQGRYTHNNKYQKTYDVEGRDKEKRKFVESYNVTFITINETYS